MPALGQKRRQWAVRRGGSGISQCESNVRFIPNAEDVRYGMRRRDLPRPPPCQRYSD
jgi:hypothetical protein